MLELLCILLKLESWHGYTKLHCRIMHFPSSELEADITQEGHKEVSNFFPVINILKDSSLVLWTSPALPLMHPASPWVMVMAADLVSASGLYPSLLPPVPPSSNWPSVWWGCFCRGDLCLAAPSQQPKLTAQSPPSSETSCIFTAPLVPSLSHQ